MDGIPMDRSIKTLNLKYHYHNVFEPIHYHLVLMVLPGVVPPPEVYEALQLADLTVEAHEDIILVGVWEIHFLWPKVPWWLLSIQPWIKWPGWFLSILKRLEAVPLLWVPVHSKLFYSIFQWSKGLCSWCSKSLNSTFNLCRIIRL